MGLGQSLKLTTDRINMLFEAIGEIEKHLDQVLIPVPPATPRDPTPTGRPSPPECAFVRDMDVINSRIASAIESITQIRTRLNL